MEKARETFIEKNYWSESWRISIKKNSFLVFSKIINCFIGDMFSSVFFVLIFLWQSGPYWCLWWDYFIKYFLYQTTISSENFKSYPHQVLSLIHLWPYLVHRIQALVHKISKIGRGMIDNLTGTQHLLCWVPWNFYLRLTPWVLVVEVVYFKACVRKCSL